MKFIDCLGNWFAFKQFDRNAVCLYKVTQIKHGYYDGERTIYQNYSGNWGVHRSNMSFSVLKGFYLSYEAAKKYLELIGCDPERIKEIDN